MVTDRVDGESVAQVVLRVGVSDEVGAVGHVTGRVELAPAQCRHEVEGRAGGHQLTAACALRHHEHVLVPRDHVTRQTTTRPLVRLVDRVSDPLVLGSTRQPDRSREEDDRSVHL